MSPNLQPSTFNLQQFHRVAASIAAPLIIIAGGGIVVGGTGEKSVGIAERAVPVNVDVAGMAVHVTGQVFGIVEQGHVAGGVRPGLMPGIRKERRAFQSEKGFDGVFDGGQFFAANAGQDAVVSIVRIVGEQVQAVEGVT